MFSIASNITSLQAQRQLEKSSSALRTSLERLSSGMRVNHASDDAAGLAIAEALKTDARVHAQAIRNVNDGLSALAIAEQALTELTNISIRQMELAQQAANGTYSREERLALDREANALVDEFNRIAASAEFNDRNLLDSNASAISIQAGYGPDGTLALNLGDALARAVGTGTFAAPITLAATGASDLQAASAGDFNNDGHDDLVALDYGGSGAYVFLGTGDGTYSSAVKTAGSDTSGVHEGPALGDFNEDGKLDAVCADGRVLLGTGDGHFTLGQVLVSSANYNTAVAGDFNGDGRPDVAIYEQMVAPNNPVRLWVYESNGDGTFNLGYQTQHTSAVSWAGYGLDAADMNGDGKDDLALGAWDGNLAVLLSNGDGFADPVSYPVVSGTDNVKAADLNRDGIIDLAAGALWTDQVHVLMGNGDGTFQEPDIWNTPNRYWGTDVVDFDGDGMPDYLMNGHPAGAAGFSIAYGNGDGTFDSPQWTAEGTGQNWAVSTTDANHDGVMDVVRYTTTGLEVIVQQTQESAATGYLNLTTQAAARESLVTIENTLNRIAMEQASIGSQQSRLSATLNTLAACRENFSAAQSQIMDVDVAEEAAKLLKHQILQQAGAAIVTQANQMPQIALRLLNG